MLPACLYRRRVLATLLELWCRRHFFTLHRLSGFLSLLMSTWAEPSFFRYFFSTYLALIQASFSWLQGKCPVSARLCRRLLPPQRRSYRELDGSGFFRPPSWYEPS